jgi:hypothetical protein
MSKYRRVWVPIKWKRGWKALPPTPTWRDVAVETMRWSLKNEPAIHYLQQRPFDPTSFLRRDIPMYADCSATTTMIYRAAGRPDPNGRDYDGTGYTGTLRAHTPKRRTIRGCKPGDFIVYGRGGGAHVVVVLESGANPLVWSHGQEAGPLTTRHSDQLAVHGSYCTAHNGDALA